MTAQRDNTAYGHGPLQRIARQQPHVKLLLGNWRNASLLSLAPSYDVVLVDYLLAAVNMHWPYHEEAVLERVLGTVAPRGGLALITGMQPYDLTLDASGKHAGDAAILAVEGLGDAAALLAGRRSYRELPLQVPSPRPISPVRSLSRARATGSSGLLSAPPLHSGCCGRSRGSPSASAWSPRASSTSRSRPTRCSGSSTSRGARRSTSPTGSCAGRSRRARAGCSRRSASSGRASCSGALGATRWS